MKGKFIVFYGTNGLGKTTQAKMLVEYLNKKGISAEYIKYPVYDIRPSGLYLNEILRGGKKQNMSEEELQMWFAVNRFQYEPILKSKLAHGISIIAEDYAETGLAWGAAKGADFEWLKAINSKFLKEDLSILFDGECFLREVKHIHEQDKDLIKRSREAHLALAKKYKWRIINANQQLDAIHKEIIKICGNVILL
jgi:dTMP kinase